MHQHQSEHGGVNVRANLIWAICGRHPIGGSNARSDGLVQRGNGRLGVGLEESVFDLLQDISHSLAFFRQLDRERCLKVGNQLRHILGLKCLEIRKCKEDPDILLALEIERFNSSWHGETYPVAGIDGVCSED